MNQHSAEPGAEPSAHDACLADSQLIVQIGQGNELALGKLYDRYCTLVYSVALHVARDQALAERVVQHVFYDVWQSANSLHLSASVPVLLMRLAHQWALAAMGLPEPPNPALKEARAFRRHRPASHNAKPQSMRGMLDRLPGKQRETLELAYYERLTCHEIAARLREPVSTIKALLRAALGTLAEAQNTAATNMSRPKTL